MVCAQLFNDRRAGGSVQRGKWLIEQQQFGTRCQRPRQSDALLFAAGERARLAIGERRRVKQIEHLCHTSLPLIAFQSMKPEADVGPRSQVRKQRRPLGNKADAPLTRLNVRARIRIGQDTLPQNDPSPVR